MNLRKKEEEKKKNRVVSFHFPSVSILVFKFVACPVSLSLYYSHSLSHSLSITHPLLSVVWQWLSLFLSFLLEQLLWCSFNLNNHIWPTTHNSTTNFLMREKRKDSLVFFLFFPTRIFHSPERKKEREEGKKGIDSHLSPFLRSLIFLFHSQKNRFSLSCHTHKFSSSPHSLTLSILSLSPSLCLSFFYWSRSNSTKRKERKILKK